MRPFCSQVMEFLAGICFLPPNSGTAATIIGGTQEKKQTAATVDTNSGGGAFERRGRALNSLKFPRRVATARCSWDPAHPRSPCLWDFTPTTESKTQPSHCRSPDTPWATFAIKSICSGPETEIQASTVVSTRTLLCLLPYWPRNKGESLPCQPGFCPCPHPHLTSPGGHPRTVSQEVLLRNKWC